MTNLFKISDSTESAQRKTIFLHIIIWVIVFLLPFVFSSEYKDSSESGNDEETGFLYLDITTKVFWVILFYLNTWVLIPKFFYKKKYILYIAILISFFALTMQIHGIFFNLIMEGKKFNFFRSSSHNILAFLFTIAISTTYKVMTDQANAERISNEKKRENLKTELSFLRSQISPHFLFNVLNNIVAMVRLKSEELEPTVLKLSSLLQYMLYENDDEKVLLKNEIEYLQSYIDLQKQRFGQGLKLTTDFQVDDEYQTIEPMLLIPFVENSFKHGTGIITKPEIHILLNLTKGFLDFSVRNRFDRTDKSKDKSSGIGLANVKRRLELLYSGKHSLSINESNGWFETRLNIKFI